MKNSIIAIPRKTEKSYNSSLKNTYVFDVPAAANKQEIVSAVESQYQVKVKGIKTLIQTGKAIRFSKGKKSNPGTTNRKDVKKAYVTLVEGNSIKVFEEVADKSNVKTEKKEKK